MRRRVGSRDGCFFGLNSPVAAPLDGCGEGKGCRLGCSDYD